MTKTKNNSQNKPSPISSFTRFVNVTTISENTTTVYGGTSFALDQVPGYTEFTALFDQYRIRKIDLDFFPNAMSITNNNSSGALVNVPTRIVTAIDYDDATAPSSLNELREYSTAQVNIMTDKFSRKFKPAVSSVVYESVGSSGYSPQFDTWISCNDPTVPHYGLKWSVPSSVGSNGLFQLAVEGKFHLEFRNSK